MHYGSVPSLRSNQALIRKSVFHLTDKRVISFPLHVPSLKYILILEPEAGFPLLVILNFNQHTMKKAIFFCSLVLIMNQTISAQANNKTNLSLQVSSAAAANRAQLANYVWTRTVQVFVGGELKNTVVSSQAVGPDGKIVTTAVSATPTDKIPGGIRGDIAKKKIAEMKAYVDDALQVSVGYLYMSKGKMVDFFDNGGIAQSGNTITVTGSNVNKPNDQLIMKVASGTLAYISQSFSSTVTSGDAISGTINYKTFNNGLTAINNGELDLPAKNMKLMVSNTGYAKKLQ